MPTTLVEFVILPFVTALLAGLLLTPVVIRIVIKVGLIDDPKRTNHPGIIHTKPIPRGGGIALFLAALIPACIFLPNNPVTIAIFLASFIALIIGVVDDKLNAQFGGILHLDTIKIPLFGSYTFLLADLITMLWIIWVMNMLNWSKGVDGQMPGIVMISALIIGILSLRFPSTDPSVALDAKLSFIIAGSALSFLFYNYYPAKILPGYGATAIYLLLAVVSILSSSKLATAILVMGVPTVDALFTIIRRVKDRRSPFLADKKHLHHLLLKLGWSQRKIALFYWAISAILGIIALLLQSRSKLFAIIMLLVIVGGGLYFLHRVMQQSNEKTTS